MRIQTILLTTLFTFVAASVSATAAIINQVDYPEAFVTSKDKETVILTTEHTSVSDVKK